MLLRMDEDCMKDRGIGTEPLSLAGQKLRHHATNVKLQESSHSSFLGTLVRIVCGMCR